MTEYFQKMLAFEAWANARLLDWLEAHPGQTEAVRIFAHLVAENLPWLHLLRGERVPASVDPEPDWSLTETRAQLDAAMADLQAFARSIDEAGLGDIVRSPGPNGVVFENTVAEVLTGLLNHAEHHRGQLLLIIARETGEYVPSLYFSYLRKVAASERAA